MFLDLNIKRIDEFRIELCPEQSSIGIQCDTFYNVKPLVYRNKRNKLLSFNEQSGKIIHGFTNIDSEHFSIEKISFLKSSKFIFPLIGFIVSGYLGILCFIGIKFLVAKFRKKTKLKTALIILNAIIALTYLISFFLTIGNIDKISIDIPFALYIIQILPLIFILSIGLLIYNFIKQNKNLTNLAKGLTFFSIVLGCLFLIFALNFNLIGHKF